MAKIDGHKTVYVSTDATGLYEKYGFCYLKIMPDIWGGESRVYKKDL